MLLQYGRKIENLEMQNSRFHVCRCEFEENCSKTCLCGVFDDII